MPQSQELKEYPNEKKDLQPDALVSANFFPEISTVEAIEDKIAEIDGMILRANEELLLGVNRLAYSEAFLKALVKRLAELIEGYDEPVELIREARLALNEAEKALRRAREKHGELVDSVRLILKEK